MPIPTWGTQLQEVADGVFAYIQAGGHGLDSTSISNAGAIVGGDATMVIDTLASPHYTKAFKAAMQQVGAKPVRHVVNTHSHQDHFLGNYLFAPAEVVAHDLCREAILERGVTPKERYYPTLPHLHDAHAEIVLSPPTTTFNDQLTYRYGDKKIELFYLGPAHSNNDVLVYIPDDKVLFAGDIAFHYQTPVLQGTLTGWLGVLDAVEKMDVEKIVPGHGPVGTKKELQEMRGYLELVKREIKQRYDAGMSPGEAAADIDRGPYQDWNNPERLSNVAVRLYLEFAGTPHAASDPKEVEKAREDYAAAASKRS